MAGRLCTTTSIIILMSLRSRTVLRFHILLLFRIRFACFVLLFDASIARHPKVLGRMVRKLRPALKHLGSINALPIELKNEPWTSLWKVFPSSVWSWQEFSRSLLRTVSVARDEKRFFFLFLSTALFHSSNQLS